MESKIVAQWFDCSKKDIKMYGYERELIILESNHPKYVIGSRFDFGYLNIANKEGYTVEIRPYKTTLNGK